MSKSLEHKPERIDTFSLGKSMSYQREIGICFVDLIPTLFSSYVSFILGLQYVKLPRQTWCLW